jgi:hypothetical protein
MGVAATMLFGGNVVAQEVNDAGQAMHCPPQTVRLKAVKYSNSKKELSVWCKSDHRNIAMRGMKACR